MGKLDSRRNRCLASLITSLIVIAILLVPTTVSAITVNVKDLEGREITQGVSFTFKIEMKIESGERVPVSKVRVNIEFPNGTSRTYEFPSTGGETDILRLGAPQSIIDSAVYGYGYGYGYGFYYGYGYGYFPEVSPYGYGYGYYPTGYGYGFYGPQTLRWTATLINTGILPTGSYTLKVEVLSDGV